MMSDIKLSVIVPCFNVASTLKRALDSILMQTVSFAYEIIIVDDASTDGTYELAHRYEIQNDSVRVIRHAKNQGNAIAFYNAITAARGDYFCVLDGDDFYTIKDKLQRQVDFLDAKQNLGYVAVVHNYFLLYPNGNVEIPLSAGNSETEFNKLDFLNGTVPYFHTGTYMYRNVFRGRNAEFFKEEILRGDSPRTFFALLFSNKKIKKLRFFGSVYTISEKGIYQGLSTKKRIDREARLLQRYQDFLQTPIERELVRKRSEKAFEALENTEDVPVEYDMARTHTKDTILQSVRREAFDFAFKQKDFMFSHFYESEYLDSLSASLGYAALAEKGYSVFDSHSHDDNLIAVVISLLNPNGGGIFAELTEIFDMYPQKQILVILTEVDVVGDDVIEKLRQYENVKVIAAGDKEIGWFFDLLLEKRPSKTYFYVGHTSAIAQALIQPGLSKNIHVLSYDHGFVLSLTNQNYDSVIIKRPVDYWLLKSRYGDRAVYIPSWNNQESKQNLYVPFNGHDKIITASGCARYYKVDGTMVSYIDTVLAGLLSTSQRHIHYGPLPEAVSDKIKSFLEKNNLATDSFVHIEWADNLQKSLIENNVDLFIEPFPTVSYKMTLNALAAGVPIFAYAGQTRLSTLDFIYPDNLTFINQEDYLNKLSGFTKEVLQEHSRLSFEYFNKTHSMDVLKTAFLNEEEVTQPQKPVVSDNFITDVADIWPTMKKLISKIGKNGVVSQVAPAHARGFLGLKGRMCMVVYLSVFLLCQIPLLRRKLPQSWERKSFNKIKWWWR